MKKYIYLLIFLPSLIHAQTNEQRIQKNLQKYWDYRARLERYFVVVDGSNARCTNIPGLDIRRDKKTLYYGDANGGLQYYIGMLATEYKLLQLNGGDYISTKNKLKWALDAVERLDLNAESHFRQNHVIDYVHDNNGFFLRDDVDDEIKNFSNFPSEITTIVSCYNNPIHHHDNWNDTEPEQSGDFINSRDNLWHYIFNLALVVKLVDDPTIVTQAQYIVWRMVNHLHNWSADGLITWWIVENPVKGWYQPHGGDVETRVEKELDFRGLRYGIATAGNSIAYGSGLNNLWQEPIQISKMDVRAKYYDPRNWIRDFLWISVDDRLSKYLLETVKGDGDWYLAHNLLRLKYVKNTWDIYEHLPLAYQVLHGSEDGGFDPNDSEEINKYLTILDELPAVNEPPDCNGRWFHENRLVDIVAADKTAAERCNGAHIDYLLLHNLFWLVYVQNLEDCKTYNSFSQIFWERRANKILIDKTPIPANSFASDYAGSCIILQPGFHAPNGSLFSASVGNEQIMEFEGIDHPLPDFPLFNCSEQLTKEIDVTTPLSYEPPSDSDDQVFVTPNPTKAIFNVELKSNISKITSIEVYSISGQLMISKTQDISWLNQFNTNNWQAGIYIVRVNTSEGYVVKRLIKQ